MRSVRRCRGLTRRRCRDTRTGSKYREVVATTYAREVVLK